MELIGSRPERKLVAYFLVAIIVGTILLALPVSHGDREIGLLDALFTSTSAVCVTGLIVVDTGTAYSLFGQIVIMILIQLGGLGIMTFATGLLMSVLPRLSFQDNLVLTQTFSASKMFKAKSLVRAVLTTALLVELIGAVLLFVLFLDRFPVSEAAYYAVFHSISAFCNAGFSTFSNSLESFQGNVGVMLVFSFLIIVGGLGFAVVSEVVVTARQKRWRLSLHSKICLSATAVLLALGTAAFIFAERQNVFAHMSMGKALLNAFFQSVTSRTAGFNSIPQANLTEVSILVTMLLMFIGACPGSTGGGIKASTAAIVMLLAWNRLLGRTSVTAFRRSISQDSIVRATTLVLVSTVFIAGLFVLMMFAEEKPVPHLLSHGWFVDSLFEIVSAFGTVGLSLGATGHLAGFGKVITIILMFTGRVGVLTLMYSLSRRPRGGQLVYPDEQVMVG